MKLKSSGARNADMAGRQRVTRGGVVATLASSIMTAASTSALASGDAARGENVYRTCMACHLPDKNGIGPMHNGVFGSKAGSVAGYDYSAALKNSGLIWTTETLDPWLANPQALVPGSKMLYRVVNPQDRADVIEYLKSKSGRQD